MANQFEGDACTVSQVFKHAVLNTPEKEAIYDGEKRLTYGEIDAEADLLASGLIWSGIEKEDRVAVCLPNWNEFMIIFMALSKIGAILIPLNIDYRKNEIIYILENSGAKAVFFTNAIGKVDQLSQLMEAQKNIPTLKQLISVRFQQDSINNYDQLIQLGRSSQAVVKTEVGKDDICVILYTSGTTGNPKGVMLANGNMVSISRTAANKMECSPEDVFLIPVPLFHIMGLMLMLRSITCRGRLVLMERFKAEKALEFIQHEKVTVHPGVPTMFILELNHPKFPSYDLSSLRTGEMAAAPCPIEILRRIKIEMKCNILVAYGMTETSASLTMTNFEDDDLLRAETVGRAMPGAEVKIVNENREEVPPGTVGELACKSPGLMKGYFRMEEETRKSKDEHGWFYTGDLATMDDAGYIRIVGRKKELIIRGGYNIYPREVEEVYYQHPNVMEAAIIGLPDTVLGEITCAVIRLRPGKRASEEEMRSFAEEKLVSYKVPNKFVFLDELPMTSSGKILKRELIRKIKSELKEELR
ncbi:class I adenylate-forming enzyme family protein [Peribacillus simplex]|uniref:Long-chain acyl-CoA synthetase n=1 Tax=Peribacillus simplex NBRC 15720 = DSM 1321 TaxID=1349754 RepID=A0A223EEQ2_9BACI|nr:long-chain-fatty-acid--CoA ligase [Peribacillus simplex]ASS93732.1 long-chain acyl-CoA synthetase [Peribacillus simplex NBRC 15720 = DSM 1321]MEC1399427.1 long-chain-fatty-acid--CoA ligase [Peribacillus simplex]